MANATEVKPSFYLGKVVSELPELQVKLEDITLNTEDLMIDQWLLDRSTLEWVAYDEDAEHSLPHILQREKETVKVEVFKNIHSKSPFISRGTRQSLPRS